MSNLNKKREAKDIDELMTLYLKSKDNNRRRIVHIRIVNRGMELVKRIAAPLSKQTGTSFEDLVQVGALGLVKAIEFYSPDKNAKFSTYAIRYIKGELSHYTRDKLTLIKTPRHLHELIIKVSYATKELKTQGIQDPSAAILADYLKVPQERIEEVIKIDKFKFMISLDQIQSSDEENTSLLEKIPDGDYLEIERINENKMMIENAVNKLPPDLKEIIELSFFEELNQREISDKMGISQMQVSRRLKKALHELYSLIIRN